jgi:hypothetical protein
MEQASLIIGNGNWAVKSGSLLGYTMFNEQFYPQDITASRATTATRVNPQGLIEEVASGIARIDYSTGEAALLVEPQRTNAARWSEQFEDVLWQKIASNITANSTTSPSGNLNADKFFCDTSNTDHRIRLGSSIAAGSTVTFSCYAKKAEFKYFRLGTNSGGTNSVLFDLESGTVVSSSGGAIGSIVALQNGWYRCITTAIVGTVLDSYILDNSLNQVYLGDGTSGVYIWGAQLESGSYATSYIPTTSTSVTRNADVTSKTGVSSLIGQTEGTIYAEIKVSKLLGAVSRYIFHLSDGTANNRIYMAFSGASSNILRGRIFSGGTLQCTIDSSTITSNGTYKLALAYKNNDITFYINGVQIGVNTSATIPTGSRVDVGNNYAGASQFSDGISAASIRGTRLTNTQLATLTTL